MQNIYGKSVNVSAVDIFKIKKEIVLSFAWFLYLHFIKL